MQEKVDAKRRKCKKEGNKETARIEVRDYAKELAIL